MYIWELCLRFKDFIMKDTQSENESKKTAVVIRILTLSFILYLLILMLMINWMPAKGGLLIYLIALLAFG